MNYHNFTIVPVIDILNSKAVHAVEGRRSEYKPLNSYLFNSTNPKKIIKTLHRIFNFSTYYIADLDSIMNKNLNINILRDISNNSPEISIILDPGIENEYDFEILSDLSNIKIIIGLETISGLNIISEAINHLGRENIIISVDMYNGNIFSKNQYIRKFQPLEIINELESLKVNQIILLDLFRVGQKIGGIPPLYKKVRKSFNGKILVGGGIKNILDIKLYWKNNFSGVLVGTALYDRSIKKKDIKSFFEKINQL